MQLAGLLAEQQRVQLQPHGPRFIGVAIEIVEDVGHDVRPLPSELDVALGDLVMKGLHRLDVALSGVRPGTLRRVSLEGAIGLLGRVLLRRRRLL